MTARSRTSRDDEDVLEDADAEPDEDATDPDDGPDEFDDEPDEPDDLAELDADESVLDDDADTADETLDVDAEVAAEQAGDEDEDAADVVGVVPPDVGFDDDDLVTAVTGDDEVDDDLEGLREGEFVCRSCFMAKRETQLSDPKRQLCRDCA